MRLQSRPGGWQLPSRHRTAGTGKPEQIRPTPTEWASAPFQSSRNGKEHRGQSASASLVGLNPSGRGVALGEALPRPHRVHPLSLQMRSTITAHDAPT